MKKIVAVLVALMMLALPLASAETMFFFADPVVSVSGMDIDLTGLEIAFAGGLAGETDAAKILIKGSGKTLFTFDVNVVGNNVLITGDGINNVYSFEVPEEATQNLDFSNFQIPDEVLEEITGIVMGSIEIDEENGTMRIPYTAVNDILAAVAPTLESANIPGLNISDMVSGIEDMKANDNGIDLQGDFTADDDGNVTASFAAYMVEGGTVADTAAFALNLATSAEGFSCTIDAGEQGSFTLGIAGDKLTIAANVQGSGLTLTGRFGTTEEDVELVTLDAASAIDIASLSEEERNAVGVEFGTAMEPVLEYVFETSPILAQLAGMLNGQPAA